MIRGRPSDDSCTWKCLISSRYVYIVMSRGSQSRCVSNYWKIRFRAFMYNTGGAEKLERSRDQNAKLLNYTSSEGEQFSIINSQWLYT